VTIIVAIRSTTTPETRHGTNACVFGITDESTFLDHSVLCKMSIACFLGWWTDFFVYGHTTSTENGYVHTPRNECERIDRLFGKIAPIACRDHVVANMTT
jgi:hypothetical protein